MPVLGSWRAATALWPSAADAFPLGTPALSVIGLTVLVCLLRGLHELCHWLAARRRFG